MEWEVSMNRLSLTALCMVLMWGILEGALVTSGCSNKSPSGPVTVTQYTPLCDGTWGDAFVTGESVLSMPWIYSLGVSITGSSPVTAYNVEIYLGTVPTADTMAQAAIYAGPVSGPTTLIVQSAPLTAVGNSWNQFTLSSTVLAPAHYWLAFWSQNNLDLEIATTNDGINYLYNSGSAIYSGSFPSTQPSSSAAGNPANVEFSIYLSTCP